MKVTTNWVNDEVYEAQNEQDVKVVMDMSDASKKQGQSPVELLLSAVSGCVAIDVVIMLKKKRKEIRDFKIEATGVRKETYPRGFSEITLHFILESNNTKKEDLLKVAKLAIDKYCSVADTLKPAINMQATIKE